MSGVPFVDTVAAELAFTADSPVTRFAWKADNSRHVRRARYFLRRGVRAGRFPSDMTAQQFMALRNIARLPFLRVYLEDQENTNRRFAERYGTAGSARKAEALGSQGDELQEIIDDLLDAGVDTREVEAYMSPSRVRITDRYIQQLKDRGYEVPALSPDDLMDEEDEIMGGTLTAAEDDDSSDDADDNDENGED